jgi:hypothetical protein
MTAFPLLYLRLNVYDVRYIGNFWYILIPEKIINKFMTVMSDQ